MPGTTPDYELPYPLGTDSIRDGNDVIKSLAEAVDASLGAQAVDDDGWSNAGLVWQTNWADSGFTQYRLVSLGPVQLLALSLSATYNGPNVSISSSGGIADQAIVLLPVGHPVISTRMVGMGFSSSVLTVFSVAGPPTNPGMVNLAALANNVNPNLVAGTTFVGTGLWLVG